MILLVGLGNPTPDSNDNRHNVGFKIIDAINQKFSLSKQKPKFKGLLTTGNISNKKVYAIKPLTFMNNSGICIRELIEWKQNKPIDNIIHIHGSKDVIFPTNLLSDYIELPGGDHAMILKRAEWISKKIPILIKGN